MKQIYNILLVSLAVMLLGVGCTPEPCEEPTATTGVRFMLQKPQALTTETTTTVDMLVWEVYDAQGKKIKALGGSEAAFTGGTTHFVSIDLLDAQVYTVVFWAQNSSCDVFAYADLTDIQLDYTKAFANEATMDAFYGIQTVGNNDETTHTVQLHRPFAQVNLLVTPNKWDGTMTESAITVSKAATRFNALTGEGSNVQEVMLAMNSNAANENVTLEINGTSETYKHAAMGYVIPAAQGKTLVDVTFTLSERQPIKATNTVMEANYRTNIIM